MPIVTGKNMSISRITEYNNLLYQQVLINNVDKRHDALVLEELRLREDFKSNQAKRTELNRLMNRPGQNVDEMA
jgi:hypothetical protein